MRFWVQAKIQGMARREAMPCWPERAVGRLPMFSRPSSCSGVAALKYLRKTGLLCTICSHRLLQSLPLGGALPAAGPLRCLLVLAGAVIKHLQPPCMHACMPLSDDHQVTQLVHWQHHDEMRWCA